MADEIRFGRRQAHNLYDSDGTQIGAMFTKEWGVRIVEGYNAGTGAAPDREVLSRLLLTAIANVWATADPESITDVVLSVLDTVEPFRNAA